MIFLVLDGDWSVFFEVEGVKQGVAVLCVLSYRFTTDFVKDAQDPRDNLGKYDILI